MKQLTIKESFELTGIGMHSGERSRIRVNPAPEDCGTVFIKNGERIKASVENVVGTKLATSLRGIRVVEHFLAAAFGLGIDNLEVEVEGEELPVLDGSALPYVEAFKSAGIVEQNATKNLFILEKNLQVQDENKSLFACPHHELEIDFTVDYPVAGKQYIVFKEEAESFAKEIAPARTFGYTDNLKEMQSQGFALGASMENALAIGKEGYLNTPRFKDEAVRHKVLDLIGDLALLGRPLQAKLVAHQSSHRLNVELVRLLSFYH